MMTLGFNMEGTEARFEHWLEVAFADEMLPFGHRNYLEIGVAKCRTLLAVASWLNTHTSGWTCVGTDVMDGPYFSPAEFFRECALPCRVVMDTRATLPMQEGVTVSLSPLLIDPRYRFIQLCLIDACHGKDCVIHEFASIEAAMNNGGIVAFHDACEEDQGGESIQHCGKGITVREALRELDLLPGSKRFRKGWNFLEEVHGDKTRNGNGFVFIQKL